MSGHVKVLAVFIFLATFSCVGSMSKLQTCAAHDQELLSLCDILKLTLLMASIDSTGFLLWRRFGVVVGYVGSTFCNSFGIGREE